MFTAGTDDGRLLLKAYAENNDRTALSEFFALHQDNLYSFSLRVLRNPDDAQDALQMAFVDVMRRSCEHARLRSIRGWLFGIVRKACRLIIRSGQRRVRSESVVRERRGWTMNRTQGSTQEFVDLKDSVLSALQQLPQHYREPVLLCYCHGLSEAQAAEVLSEREGTIRVQLSRGFEMIRSRLAASGVAPSVVILSNALANLPKESPPDSLRAHLDQLAHGAPLRRSIRVMVQKERIRKVAPALAISLIGAGLVVWFLGDNGHPPQKIGVADGVGQPVETNTSGSSTINLLFAFDSGLPASFRVLEGKGGWQPSAGPFSGVIRFEKEGCLEFPLKLDGRPVMATIRYGVFVDRKDPGFSCSLFRKYGRNSANARSWHKTLQLEVDKGRVPVVTVTYYWIGKHIFIYGGDELTHVDELEDSAESESMLLKLKNVAIDQLEIKTLEPNEIPEPLRSPANYLKSLGLKMQRIDPEPQRTSASSP